MTSPEPTVVRACQPADAEAVAHMAVGMGRADSIDHIRQRVRRFLRRTDHRLCVASRAGRLVGYAWAQNYGPHLRDGEAIVRIHDLFVQPDDRRGGIGRAMFDHVRDWAAQQDARYLQWQASRDALPFYAAMGLVGDPCPDPGHPFFEIVLEGELLDPQA